jgi:hypothetical protein
MRTPFLLLSTLLLVACQSLPGYQRQTGPTPEPAIDRVTLHQALQIRADYASVYIQDGAVRATNTADEYRPHCILELRTVAPVARTIAPDTFTVTGLHRDRFMVDTRGLQLAALAMGGDFSQVVSITTLGLHSDRQPEVIRLHCRQFDEPYWARHVSRKDMQQALGEIMTLE